MWLPNISFLIAIQAAAIQALREPVNQALAPREPPPDDIQLQAVTNTGNGCPSHTLTTGLSPDKTLVTYGFDSMRAAIGPGVSLLEKRKMCYLQTSLESRSQAASFTIATITYMVQAILDPGVNLTVEGTWTVSGAASAKPFLYKVNYTDGNEDPFLRRFRGDMTVPPEERVWTPCGDVGMFTANLRVMLESANATGSGLVDDDIFWGHFVVHVGLDWRQCNESLS